MRRRSVVADLPDRGLAAFYPVARGLVQVPGLRAARAASYGALASATAILAAPWLAALGAALDQRAAFLITVSRSPTCSR